MKPRKQCNTSLSGNILAAMAMIDPKGLDQNVTLAMTIVFEAFRSRQSRKRLSAAQLFDLANSIAKADAM